MTRFIMVLMLAIGLAACETPGIVEKEYVYVNVPVDRPCPDQKSFEAVMAARPVPIRDQDVPKPETPEAELAIVKPQLGRYEARGAYADQAERVIRSCYERAGLDPPP